jgi:FMN-dependent NADH-azoreductase
VITRFIPAPSRRTRRQSTVVSKFGPITEEGAMKVLHVIASPRGADSNSLRVSTALLGALQAQRADIEIEVLDLFKADLPALASDNIETKYTLLGGRPVDSDHVESWQAIEELIARFLDADAYVISTPMWNFGIPYALKYYIDCIVQPGYLFRLNELSIPVPLVHGKKMVCVTTRGNDYSSGSPIRSLDFQQPYLKAIFGFVGITDLEFISVDTTDVPSLRDASFATAAARARAVADAWSRPAGAIGTPSML